MKIPSKAILRGGFFFTADSPLSANTSHRTAYTISYVSSKTPAPMQSNASIKNLSAISSK
jgi:hypothetical protein